MKEKEHSRGRRVEIVGKCKNCGGDFVVKYKGKVFCSHDCYSKEKTGRSHAWGSKIGDALRGKKKTKKHIFNASRAHRGISHPNMKGEKH